jgi:hypothetical protein
MALASEMETLIQVYNMDLVNELAHRDELEYEKEVKNRFITLLVNIQDQRRKLQGEKKKLKGFAKLVDSPSQVVNAIYHLHKNYNEMPHIYFDYSPISR